MWNLINNGQNLPNKPGVYLITVAEIDDGIEARVTRAANFRKTKSGYQWTWYDEFGSNTLSNTCKSSWKCGISEHGDRIVAWASLPESCLED